MKRTLIGSLATLGIAGIVVAGLWLSSPKPPARFGGPPIPGTITGAELQAIMDGSGQIVLPGGVIQIDKPLMMRRGAQLVGSGRHATTIQASYRYGPVLCCLTPTALTIGGGGPLADDEGFLIGNPCSAQIDLSETMEFWRPTQGAPWWFELQFKYESGTGTLWAMGGTLTPDDVHPAAPWQNHRWAQVTIAENNGQKAILLYARTIGAAVWSAPIDLAGWNTLRITVAPTGGLTLTLNGADVTCDCPPVALRWFDRLLIGGHPIRWPNEVGPETGALKAKVRNLKLSTSWGPGGIAEWPMTDGNGFFFESAPTNFETGYLFAKPTTDLGLEMMGVKVADLTLGGQGHNIGLYVNNCQQSDFERVETRNCYEAALFTNNCYANSVSSCYWSGTRSGFVAVKNAHQFTQTNCTFNGGRCSLAIFDSAGAGIQGGWCYGTSGGVFIIADGFGTTLTLSGLALWDENTTVASPCLLLRRSVDLTVVGCHFGRLLDGPIGLVDAGYGGQAIFQGGRLSGARGGTVPAFKLYAPPASKIRLDRVTKFADSPPWHSTADAGYFDVSQPAPP